MGKIKEIIMHWRMGMLRDIYREAVEVAKRNECAVRFEFNELIVIVDQTCDFELSNENGRKIHDAVGHQKELFLC